MKKFAPEALYINWPVLEPALHDRYYRAVKREIERFIYENYDCDVIRKTVASWYIAGQPASFPVECLLDTCSILRVMTLEEAEISLASSWPLPTGYMALLHTAGINRINYRVRDPMSSWLPYLQTAADHQNAVDLSLEDSQGWKELVYALVCAGVPHISLSFPAGEEGHDAERTAELYLWAVDYVEKAGLRQYSTYDFAVPGFESVQQKIYATGGTYRGFGVGACSFDGSTRYQMTEDVLAYCHMRESDTQSYHHEEEITEEQKRFERLMLALTTTGISVHEVKQGDVNDLCAAGLGRVQAGIFSLTPRGRLVENEIITKIFWN